MNNDFVSHSFGLGGSPIEMFQDAPAPNEIKLTGDVSGTGYAERTSECNTWLPYAAKEYEISSDIRDYVLVPTVGLISGIPNTNGDSVVLKELLRFNPEHGKMAYKTLVGKPTFYEHDNQNIKAAKGIILDAFLRPLKRFGNNKYYKLVILTAYDKTKDPMLVNSVLNGENNAYSVGYYFKSYACSICGATVGQEGGQPCSHTFPRKPTYKLTDGRLVYRECSNIVFFENSIVGSPAYVSNVSNILMQPSML